MYKYKYKYKYKYLFPNYTVNNEQCISYLFHNQLGFTVIGGHQRPRDITPSVVSKVHIKNYLHKQLSCSHSEFELYL